ncbi:helix-turn-helix domain-containing protein [Nocardia brasiliensis]|uniref:helix-turn-helix domain-containing protein n=1 Tax=Nocardia brasiliensis TaxID=37326 RepID=UPI002455EB6B|nr:helix-turn-helix transcriptional regulator [Nocardia brasiliensis]
MQELGLRLREMRHDAGINGSKMASLTGWNKSKVTRLELGQTRPSVADLRAYCTHAGALDQLPDLTAKLHHLEAAYVEWRRMLSAGTKRGQQESLRLARQTKTVRAFQPAVIPGLLQTAEYAQAVLRDHVAFLGIPDDVDAGVSLRLERQETLYRGDHRAHMIIGEQALRATVGGNEVMVGQLDRLLAVMGLPRAVLGIIKTEDIPVTAATNFVIFDDRLVTVETVTAELTITQPSEISLYDALFQTLTLRAIYGEEARSLITETLAARTDGTL